MVNLKDLKYLVTLADTSHFGRAAEICAVSQPTLSAQLKKLEQYLGVELVERQPNRVRLTEVGREIAERARVMLHEGDAIVDLARHYGDPLVGRLRLALIPTVGPYLLPRVTQKIRKALPKLKLMLYEHQTESLLERLRRGEIDMGILALPVPSEGLEVRKLYDEDFVVALPANHSLADKLTIKSPDLKGQTVLLLEDGHCMRDQALEVCSRVDMRETDDFRATSLETLRQMVVAGLGVTLLPQLAIEPPFGGQRGMVIRPFAKPAPTRTIGAVWRKSSTRARAIGVICDVVAKALVR